MGKITEIIDIFGLMHPKYKLPGHLRIFESFAGVGMQRMALDKLGVEYTSVGISEIDVSALKVYEVIHGDCKNYGDISKINGSDMPDCDMFTYSFPCTDLSKAGHQKGLNNTRSGLVYQVLRLLKEMKVLGKLPSVLLMENVIDLIQVRFIKQFNDIQKELEELGYQNYTHTLNSKDYGVAQNRARVFMVSILGDYSYNFPVKKVLAKKLKHYLEEKVDIKYYLTDKQVQQIVNWKAQQCSIKNAKTGNEIVQCITAKSNTSMNSSMLLLKESKRGVVNVIEATKKGYAEATDGDGIYINRNKHKRGVVQKGMVQTIKTSCADIGVVIEKGESMYIRKLTPRECWRLMGIDDLYFDKAKKVTSKTQLYKQAGNGIVVDVLVDIFGQML